VDAAAAREDGAGVDRDDLAPRVRIGQDRAGLGIRSVLTEAAGDDAAAHDEVVDVAPVDEALVVAQGRRRGQLEDLETASGPVPPDVRRKRTLADGLPDSPGVYLFRGPRDEVLYGRVPAGSVVVPGTLPSSDGKVGLYCAVIVKRVDARTRAKTAINELLRGD